MTVFDLAIVGSGPTGSAAALGALRTDPSLRVALLDRADFPRDKSCGDGIAPHVIDLLERVGVTGVVDGHASVPRLRLLRGAAGVERAMARPTWVIPRAVFDHRLRTAAAAAGASLLRHRVRDVHGVSDGNGVGDGRDGRGTGVVILDGEVAARTVIGADGVGSVVRRVLGVGQGPLAVAIRGYTPTPSHRAAAQTIVFDTARQPAYAWSFDRGDGLSNVGYGQLLGDRIGHPSRALLLDRLEALLPGASEGGPGSWKGALLPLSSGRWPRQEGRVLLAGDAAGLVNPMTGEGIYYAVATGLAAGRAAAQAVQASTPESAGARYTRVTRRLLAAHLRHIDLAARLSRVERVLGAGLRASARHQRVFDDLVELGLARGHLTAPMVRGLGRELLRPSHHPDPLRSTVDVTEGERCGS